jgi:3-hydroxyacyl-CoA dehydrogenase/3a,7a,12a-trihydroxy-5b-cholest-24-enoyl-CoA hydratase
MANELRFDDKVVIITGAGNGLGRSHALLFGSRGAKVVVNDLGGGMHGGGKSSAAADKVVEEIKAAGGDAVANYDSVEDGAKIVQSALDHFKRIDIIVNNAGILRDTTFHKMTQEDWDLIYRVHVLGSFRVTHAAWPHMRDQGYGRVIMTASAAGIYGNFGQANYSMAKLGLVGLSNTLALEGKKRNVLVNTIAPIAGSRLTETVLPKEIVDALKPEYVSALVALLCHESSTETGGLFEVGGGFVAKLRWERAVGKTFKLGRPMTLEGLKGGWKEITGFDKTEHPTDITSSMQPVLSNVQAGPSKGGNDLIDVDAALGYEFPPMSSSYEERDLALYALGVGAAQNPLDEKELRFAYEMHPQGFLPLPTYGVVPCLKALMENAREGRQAPGMNYGLDRLLHGEQYTEIKRPLPAKAKLSHKIRIKDIFDKGKNAIVVTEVRSYDESGELLIYNEFSALIRGAGGWGGDRGPSAELNVPPNRAPDATITEKTDESQALLYRLTGDWNPLHADPSFAKAFGFDRPILHGLCTFGYAGRHVVKSFSNGDPRFFKSIKARFADSVFPGETLVTEMWKESDTRVVFRTKVKERDKVVISNAAVELYKEIPQAPARPKAAPAAQAAATTPAAASAEPQSGDIFVAIGKHLEKSPELVQKVQTVYLFKLSQPESAWTVDVKAGKVAQGAVGTADCTLELSDADFMGMCTGKLDAQKLYFGGKLKISGNVMASQKLQFLSKMDPQLVIDAMKARGAVGPGAAAPTPPTSGSAPEASSRDVFIAIADHVERNPELAAKLQTVFQFKLSDPASTWALDLKNGKGALREGVDDKADVTLELSDADFFAMASGQADPQKLYFSGKLKISGNVMASQKLSFLKKIDPEQAKAAVLKARGGGAAAATGGAGKAAPAAAAAASSTAPAQAPAIFQKLKERLAKEPGLAKEVDAVVAFKVRGPDADWLVSLRGTPEVKQGADPKANSTLTLADGDLVALAKGSATAQQLFQQGKLRIDGDVRVAHRLGFLKGLA